MRQEGLRLEYVFGGVTHTVGEMKGCAVSHANSVGNPSLHNTFTLNVFSDQYDTQLTVCDAVKCSVTPLSDVPDTLKECIYAIKQ